MGLAQKGTDGHYPRNREGHLLRHQSGQHALRIQGSTLSRSIAVGEMDFAVWDGLWDGKPYLQECKEGK